MMSAGMSNQVERCWLDASTVAAISVYIINLYSNLTITFVVCCMFKLSVLVCMAMRCGRGDGCVDGNVAS